MIDSEWIPWIGLTLFALLVLRRLGVISRTLRAALLPSREASQPGHLLHEMAEIRRSLANLQEMLQSVENSLILIREHLRDANLASDATSKAVISDFSGLHRTLERIDYSLVQIEERLNPENRIYSYKAGW